jgi:hypothetical protein
MAATGFLTDLIYAPIFSIGTIDSREHGLNLPEEHQAKNKPYNRRKV